MRSQAAGRLLGALFREGYMHSPSWVESQVAKAFRICQLPFTVLYISHRLRKHILRYISWFSHHLALVKGGISGYLYLCFLRIFIQWAAKFQVWVSNILILKTQATTLNFFLYCSEALRGHSYRILKFYWPSISPRLQAQIVKKHFAPSKSCKKIVMDSEYKQRDSKGACLSRPFLWSVRNMNVMSDVWVALLDQECRRACARHNGTFIPCICCLVTTCIRSSHSAF